ncbi:Cys-tRNA(Pro) deacylase [Vagococcus acidifermentans]|uniref:Cys-tRNA(Pro)/Cys-tRNA(Cys) deacylase n=1 Tax=Vagococcus acidifermentans TaxID=564710 RepID=A0A430AZG3_9ENTE|nr:Cys-tRNA(Pro) deacylase [Vagococcus acidifermentans]RSU13448.1 aminoacyl-tRNA deacylase [Vagococcus acidifermentans]
MAKKKPHKTNALRILEQKKIPFEISEYEWTEHHTGAFETADTLGISPRLIFKTLVAVGNKTGPLVAVIPGSDTLDLKKLAKISGNKKVDMLPQKELEPLTGYVHGGCSPVGMKKQLATFFSDKALSFDSIYVSAGKRGLQMRVSPQQLAQAVNGTFADVTVEKT